MFEWGIQSFRIYRKKERNIKPYSFPNWTSHWFTQSQLGRSWSTEKSKFPSEISFTFGWWRIIQHFCFVQTEEDSREGRLCSLRGQTSNEELQSAINNDTSAIQDSQNNEEDQTFSRSTRDANDFLEGDDCVDKDELAITLTVTNILNGLTWYNIEQRQEEIGALTIDTEKRLLIVLNLIYKQVFSNFMKSIADRFFLSWIIVFLSIRLSILGCQCWSRKIALIC